MRGSDVRTGELFSYVDLEDRVRRDHPLRAIRQIVTMHLSCWNGSSQQSIRPSGVHRSRLRSFYAPCFCKPSIPSALSGF